MELWLIWTNALLDRFPPGIRDMVRRCEREGRTDEKEYARALQMFFKKHICSLDPLPPELQLAFEVGNKDTTSNDVLIGPNQFDRTGTLRSWSIVDRLHHISAPTLLLNSPDDEAQDVGLPPFFQPVPGVKWVQFAHSTHMPMYEERERYFVILVAFLMEV